MTFWRLKQVILFPKMLVFSFLLECFMHAIRAEFPTDHTRKCNCKKYLHLALRAKLQKMSLKSIWRRATGSCRSHEFNRGLYVFQDSPWRELGEVLDFGWVGVEWPSLTLNTAVLLQGPVRSGWMTWHAQDQSRVSSTALILESVATTVDMVRTPEWSVSRMAPTKKNGVWAVDGLTGRLSLTGEISHRAALLLMMFTAGSYYIFIKHSILNAFSSVSLCNQTH